MKIGYALVTSLGASAVLIALLYRAWRPSDGLPEESELDLIARKSRAETLRKVFSEQKPPTKSDEKALIVVESALRPLFAKWRLDETALTSAVEACDARLIAQKTSNRQHFINGATAELQRSGPPHLPNFDDYLAIQQAWKDKLAEITGELHRALEIEVVVNQAIDDWRRSVARESEQKWAALDKIRVQRIAADVAAMKQQFPDTFEVEVARKYGATIHELNQMFGLKFGE